MFRESKTGLSPNPCRLFDGGSSFSVLLLSVCRWLHMLCLFCHFMLFITAYFGASGRICFFIMPFAGSLRKHAYSNIMKILPPNKENFQIKKTDIFHISTQSIDCGYSLEPPRRGGSNEYPQSVTLSRNKNNNLYPVNQSFTT